MKFKIIAEEIYNEKENLGIVLADRGTEYCPYVTWEVRKPDNYFWGHYFNTLEHAKIDYHERLAQNYKLYSTPWEV